MRILIASTHVPFVTGGAELHAESLHRALTEAGHDTAIVGVPFKWYPPETILDHMLACRLLDVTESMGNRIDLLIGLKFPAYLINHPNKVLWVLHQYRDAYDLWEQPLGALHRHASGVQIRDAIRRADRSLIPEAQAVFANSRNVANRLSAYCGVIAEPLYHPPPNADAFFAGPTGDYLLFPSRLTQIKRQELVLEALAVTEQPVCVRFTGAADHAPYADALISQARRLGVLDRTEWLGQVNEEEKIEHYARCLAVLYPPRDEDYGYVTLEAMLASKPVITCSDSGGPLEFVTTGQTGIVAEPTPPALAAAMDRVWEDRGTAEEWGQRARSRYADMDITWPAVVERLLA